MNVIAPRTIVSNCDLLTFWIQYLTQKGGKQESGCLTRTVDIERPHDCGLDIEMGVIKSDHVLRHNLAMTVGIERLQRMILGNRQALRFTIDIGTHVGNGGALTLTEL